MDTAEATSLLEQQLQPFRAQSHADLQRLLLAPVAREAVGPSGRRYQVLIQAAWVKTPGETLRIIAGIDDSGWQLFRPLTEAFEVARRDARHNGA